jgi:site-specific DNA-methyltransferase (adenine-specific)
MHGTKATKKLRLPIANARNKMDGRALLRSLADNSVGLVVYDPQYRGVLNQLKYGNEGARQSKRAALPQMSDEVINEFLAEITRVLMPSRYVLMWLDKHALCEGSYPTPGLKTVDLITWRKSTLGMGYRTRRRGEYLQIRQKPPILAKATWTDHGIPDVWSERATGHTHAKPRNLTCRLIRSVTKPGDIVVDPCAGSYLTLDCCKLLGRTFIGCDLI